MKKISCLLLLIFAILVFNCTSNSSSKETEINLLWIKSYEEDTPTRAEIGLKWILSYLGAELPEGKYESSIVWKNNILKLDISDVGLSEIGKKVMISIMDELKSLQVYQQHNFIQLGNFVMQIFNNSEHYYAITNMPISYADFKAKYSFDDTLDYCLLSGESGVTNGCRIFNIVEGDSISDCAFIALEGTGSSNIDFEAKEFEVFDFMPNGQPRFAIYDLEGNLKSAASREISRAGKPAKCMWCHESRVQPLFKGKTDVEGFATLSNFSNLIQSKNVLLKNQRYQNDTVFYWKKPWHHSYAELLYTTYAKPSLERLRKESQIYGIKLKIDSTKIVSNEEYEFINIMFDSTLHRKYTNITNGEALFDPREGSE